MGLSGKQKVILGILGLVLVLVWTRALTSRPRRPGSRTPETAGILARPPAGLPASTPAGPVPEVPSGWGESPFLSSRNSSSEDDGAAGSPSGERQYKLNGILWDPQRPSAIINNRVVCVGDRLHDWQVMEIQKDRVVLSDGAATRELTVE